jgi:phosphohistidine phosphatase
MDIYLVQHGKALSKEEDPQRPLSDEGRALTEKMADYLAERIDSLIDHPITHVSHSGKLRAQQTAEILIQSLCPTITPTVQENMDPNDEPQIIYNQLTAGRDRPGAILLVGHLPHLACLAGLLLAGDGDQSPIQFTNSAVAKICPTYTGWSINWFIGPSILH